MTDAIIWADKLPDIIRKWILIVPMIFAVLGSGTGLYQYFDKSQMIEAKTEEKNKAVREVATAFQTVMIEKATNPKIVAPKSLCGDCTRRIKKLERWHP